MECDGSDWLLSNWRWARGWGKEVMKKFYKGQVGLGGLVVIVLAIGPKVRGFKPGQGWWAFKGDKNL
jgi:hypothetical protein